MAESLNAEGAPKPGAAYANATWERPGGRLLFIAGQVGITADYKPVGNGGIEEQAKQTFRNIEIIVKDAGGSMEDIVSLTIFVTDIAHAKVVNNVRKEIFDSGSGYPTSTLVQVTAFMHPSLLVEVNAVASIAT